MADTPVTKRTMKPAGDSRPGTTARLAGRPAALPNARAILGALLTVAAALLAWFAATNGGETPRRAVIVAARDIAAGAVIAAEDVRVQQLAFPEALTTRIFAAPADVIGDVSLGPVGAGDPVLASAIARSTGPGSSRQVSITLPVASAVGGYLRSGDTVDIIAIYDGNGDAPSTSQVVARNVLVSRVSGDNPKLSSPTGDRILTFAVDSNLDVEKLLIAVNSAKVHLVRTTGSPTNGVSLTPPSVAEPNPSAVESSLVPNTAEVSAP
jgi:Flp pilus assembly protein CpaB